MADSNRAFPADAGRAGGPTDLSRDASQPKALIPNAARVIIDDLGAALARLVIEAEPWEGHVRRSASFEHFRAHREARDVLIKYGFGA